MNKLDSIITEAQTLIKDNKDEKQIEALGKLIGMCNEAKKEQTEFEAQHNQLVSKYGDLVLMVGSPENPLSHEEAEKPKAKTWEECFKETFDEIDKNKNNRR